MPVSPYFDPDEVVITKPILREIIDAIVERWKQQPDKHRIQITALQMFKASLRLQSDEAIAAIFRAIVATVNEMQQYNAMLRMEKEMPTTRELADLAISRIRERWP